MIKIDDPLEKYTRLGAIVGGAIVGFLVFGFIALRLLRRTEFFWVAVLAAFVGQVLAHGAK